MTTREIQIKGAKVNNLKNIDINIPLNQFIVITGVSGSGKSSLAFDTLYAEGQRRYVESLSSYARQFLGRMSKPECDYIKGLPPAIAIEQKVTSRNPRSTVGTSTEIYDYLRMLFSRIGHTFSPVSGKEVKKHNLNDIIEEISNLNENTKIAILVDINLPEGRNILQQLEIFLKEGYSKIESGGDFYDIAEILQTNENLSSKEIRLVIDRLSVSKEKDEISRLTDSLETALFEGHQECIIKIWQPDGIEERHFSDKFSADGIDFRVPSDIMFNFNNPYGACPECEGFGKTMGISEDLVIPDKTLSVYQDAVQCWKGEKMSEWKKYFIHNSSKFNFPIHTPYCELTPSQKELLWRGKGDWEGIDGFFRWVDDNQYKIQYRVMKARFRGKTECPVCKGSRLKKDVEYVKINGHTISELVKFPISHLRNFFNNIELSDNEEIIAQRLLVEIRKRLEFMDEVGLGYLTLDRLSSTLSGGESQRINIARSLGSSLVGSLYILDEPSIGLHSRDTEKLIGLLKQLKDNNNTVIVVEHDEDIMLAADHIIDLGPDAGVNGGKVIYEGNLPKTLLSKNKIDSYTLNYLRHERKIEVPDLRRPWKKFIEIKNASENNLKNIDVKFPLGVMTVVSGVSGSGKSTLVREILYKGISKKLGLSTDKPGLYREIGGDINEIKDIKFIDQNPIGTSTRSNAATYLKAFDDIRHLFAEQQLSKQMGYTPSFFSFNAEGGRCEECKGEGVITIPMQFMADIQIECDVCHGHRYKNEILDVKYRDKNIYDFLNMSINEAIDFLNETPGTLEKKIIKKLIPLKKVGLGYIKLGQSSSTLSGGENQRIKLAYFIAEEKIPHTLFIFDEPTTGLHFHDIKILLKSLNELVDRGHTVVIIEHNLDMIKSADWIIDIGPEGGEEGGQIVATGTPESIAECKTSYTAKYLLPKLKEKSLKKNELN